MIEIISGSLYNEIHEKIIQKIDPSKLPLYGEKEIFKRSGEMYGHVKIKLDIERDTEKVLLIKSYNEYENAIKVNYFTYKWEVEESKLPKHFEQYIKPEIVKFIELLSIFKENNDTILRFSVVDGSYKETERPIHRMAVQYALIEIFKQI